MFQLMFFVKEEFCQVLSHIIWIWVCRVCG